MRVLIVDDEIHVVELIKYNLELINFQTDEAYDGEEAIRKLNSNQYDLVLLDQMLPNKSGLDVLKYIRNSNTLSNLPVLMLTAKSEESDIIFGLNLGADDYVTKPFRVHELMARVRSVLRRTQPEPAETIYQFDDMKIDVERFEVSLKDEKIELTAKEFHLLKFLVEHKNKVINRTKLLDEVWGYNYAGESRTVDVHISNLRKKIEVDYKHPKYIQTVIGEGYKFKG